MAEFTKMLTTLRRGSADRLASKMMLQLVEAVRATEKGGKIILEIGIAPLKGGDGELEVKAKIDLTLPTEEPFEPTDADWEKAAAFCAKWLRDHGYDPDAKEVH